MNTILYRKGTNFEVIEDIENVSLFYKPEMKSKYEWQPGHKLYVGQRLKVVKNNKSANYLTATDEKMKFYRIDLKDVEERTTIIK